MTESGWEVGAARWGVLERLQGLKPWWLADRYVAAEAATHKTVVSRCVRNGSCARGRKERFLTSRTPFGMTGSAIIWNLFRRGASWLRRSGVKPLLLLLVAPLAQAGTLSGTVVNRTTGKAEAGVALDLLSPTQGMAELATVTSDEQGRFSVTKDSIGMGPILIRATFHDVSFNTFAPPGRPNVDVEVYDISKDPKGITVPQHVVIFETRNDKLIGAEEYTVQNNSQPPSAYFRTEGNFDFAIPEQGTLAEVSTTTTMGMPVNQASIDKGKGRYAIAFAFRPGETNVRLSYELPYPKNAATLKLPATYAGAKMLVVVPPGITVTGDGLTSAGQEQGMLVYMHDALPAKSALTVSLSGVATAQAAGDDQGQGQGQENAQEGNSRQAQGPEVIAAASRLDDFKWFLFAGLAALFAMGALLLSRKQVIVTAGDGEGSVAGPAAKAGKAGGAPPGKAKKAVVVAAGSGNAKGAARSDVSTVVDNHVAQTMETLKDQIFRLELRRQAGTITEEDYVKEKARFDQLLRDMVQG
jgi:hypothetical protein